MPIRVHHRKSADRRSRRLLSTLSRAALAGILLSGCAAVTPAPRYTDAPRSAVVEELQRRVHADHRRLLHVVDRYLGVPYKWGGTTRQGMDCSAFARAIVRETYGIELPRTSRQMYDVGRVVPSRSTLKPGDLVFFRDTYAGPGVSHVGVYLGSGRFAHASASQGGTIAQLSSAYFDKRYAGARRVER